MTTKAQAKSNLAKAEKALEEYTKKNPNRHGDKYYGLHEDIIEWTFKLGVLNGK